MHFPAAQEEITLSITPLRVSVRSYYEGEKGELMTKTAAALMLKYVKTN